MYAEFTDGHGQQRTRVLKLLSVDPANYPDAPREGIRRVLEAETGVPHLRGQPLDTSRIAAIRMGTTVGVGCLQTVVDVCCVVCFVAAAAALAVQSAFCSARASQANTLGCRVGWCDSRCTLVVHSGRLFE